MKLLGTKRLEARISEGADGVTYVTVSKPGDPGCLNYYEVDGNETKNRTFFPEEETTRIRFEEDASGFIPMDPDLTEKMFGNAPTGIDPWGDADGRTMFEDAMNYESGRLFKDLKGKCNASD